MGMYSEHWNDYRKESLKGLWTLGLLVALGLPGSARVAWGVSQFTGDYPFVLHAGLLIAWLVAFTLLAIRYSRVTCPRCRTTYSRGRWPSNCPRCGLRMLQDDP